MQQRGDLLVLLRLQVAEREVFQLPLDMPDAQPVRQRRVDVEHFAGHPVTLVLVGVLDLADGTGTFGQLDQRHAHVIDHGHQHLAQVIDLRLGAQHQRLARIEAGTDRRHALHAIDQLADHRTEAFLHLDQAGFALAHRTVDDRRHQAVLIELEVGENLGDLQPGAVTGHTILPDILRRPGRRLGVTGKLAGLAQALALQCRIEALHVVEPCLQIDAAVLIDRLLCPDLYHGCSFSTAGRLLPKTNRV